MHISIRIVLSSSLSCKIIESKEIVFCICIFVVVILPLFAYSFLCLGSHRISLLALTANAMQGYSVIPLVGFTTETAAAAQPDAVACAFHTFVYHLACSTYTTALLFILFLFT